jgi:hypothetical protein
MKKLFLLFLCSFLPAFGQSNVYSASNYGAWNSNGQPCAFLMHLNRCETATASFVAIGATASCGQAGGPRRNAPVVPHIDRSPARRHLFSTVAGMKHRPRGAPASLPTSGQGRL